MSLIDEQGRLFGRVNLVDAIVAVVALGVIPLAYGAYLMFHAPLPRIISVSPNTFVEHQGPSALQVRGENLRPALTASFGTIESRGFLVQDSTQAAVIVPDLPPGTYDLTLRDMRQLLTTHVGALTILPTEPPAPAPAPPPPPPMRSEVQALGVFIGLSAADARAIGTGSTFGRQEGGAPIARVLAVRATEPATQRVKVGTNAFLTMPVPSEFRVPAIVRFRCALVSAECKVGDMVLTREAVIALPASAKSGPVRFLIDDIRAVDAPVTFPSVRSAVALVRVRFVSEPEILEVMKPGEVDVEGAGAVAEEDRAVLTQVGTDQQPVTAGTNDEAVLRHGFQYQHAVVSFTGTVRVPVVYTPTGWRYKDRPIKVGANFLFETIAGAMGGWIIDVKIGTAR